MFHMRAEGLGYQLEELSITDASFSGAKITITAKPSPLGGDGLVNVGFLDATGVDLFKVRIHGDLARIEAGDANADTAGLGVLSVTSMGLFGGSTQASIAPELVSHIAGPLPVVKIAGDISGITFQVSGSIGTIGKRTASGSFALFGGITVKGSIEHAVIATDGDLADLTVGGNIDDTRISARGDFAPLNGLAAQTIGRIAVGGHVDTSTILAGYDSTGAAVNADVKFGELSVGTHWSASNLVVGVTAGLDGVFGTEDDALIGGGNAIFARIARVVIQGPAFGTVGGTDHFGFVAEKIGAFRSGGSALPLTFGAGNDLAGFNIGPTFDLIVREV
jgi:hypothetical protein